VIRLGAERYYLVLYAHNLICDRVSAQAIWRELCTEYDALLSGEARPPARRGASYGEFAARQRRLGGAGVGELAEWRARLQGAPPRLELPFRRDTPDPTATVADGTIERVLSPATSRRADALAASAGVTRYVLRLAAGAAQLMLDGDARDLVLGVYLPGRPHEHRATVGLFLHLGVVRLQVDPQRAFGDWLPEVRSAVVAVAGSELPYEFVSSALAAEGSVSPEVTAIFDARVASQEQVRLGGYRTVRGEERRVAAMPWGFHLLADSPRAALVLRAEFDARIYEPTAVGAFIARLERLLARACEHPDHSIAWLGGGGD
jgi:hypothetical protein